MFCVQVAYTETRSPWLIWLQNQGGYSRERCTI